MHCVIGIDRMLSKSFGSLVKTEENIFIHFYQLASRTIGRRNDVFKKACIFQFSAPNSIFTYFAASKKFGYLKFSFLRLITEKYLNGIFTKL